MRGTLVWGLELLWADHPSVENKQKKNWLGLGFGACRMQTLTHTHTHTPWASCSTAGPSRAAQTSGASSPSPAAPASPASPRGQMPRSSGQ